MAISGPAAVVSFPWLIAPSLTFSTGCGMGFGYGNVIRCRITDVCTISKETGCYGEWYTGYSSMARLRVVLCLWYSTQSAGIVCARTDVRAETYYYKRWSEQDYRGAQGVHWTEVELTLDYLWISIAVLHRLMACKGCNIIFLLWTHTFKSEGFQNRSTDYYCFRHYYLHYSNQSERFLLWADLL